MLRWTLLTCSFMSPWRECRHSRGRPLFLSVLLELEEDKLYERIRPRFEYAILFLMGGQVHQSVACILRVDWLSNCNFSFFKICTNFFHCLVPEGSYENETELFPGASSRILDMHLVSDLDVNLRFEIAKTCLIIIEGWGRRAFQQEGE